MLSSCHELKAAQDHSHMRTVVVIEGSGERSKRPHSLTWESMPEGRARDSLLSLPVTPRADRHDDRKAETAKRRLTRRTRLQPAEDAKEGARPQAASSDTLCERTKNRCVGSLDDKAVYFVGSRSGFHLAVECSPGRIRRLSEVEHVRFKTQSRVAGICYGSFWEGEGAAPSVKLHV